MDALRLLLLSEGNAETRDSWSGTPKSLIDELRRQGHTVRVGDVEPNGMGRWVAAAVTFSPDRPRWRAKYRLAGAGFRWRSGVARRLLERNAHDVDVVLQIGATFECGAAQMAKPHAIVCDSNIRLAQEESALHYSEAGDLGTRELAAVERREARVYTNANEIFTLSERARRSFVQDFGVAPERVTAIYAGPNTDLERLRSTTGEGSKPVILFVGRQFERKGGDVLLRAFALVRQRLPEAELWIIGPSGPSGPTALTASGVRWLGFLEQSSTDGRNALLDAYRSARVFCLPTRFEPLGIAFIEAMHAGLPCVGTNVWAVPEMIVDGETGFVVPADDADALATRLGELLRNRQLASRMGQAGRQRARTMFTWEAATRRMVEKLRRMTPR